jgi:hypothetical protein
MALAVHFGSHAMWIPANMQPSDDRGRDPRWGSFPEDATSLYQNGGDIRLLPIEDRRFSQSMMICFLREKPPVGVGKSFRDFAVSFLNLEI